MAWPMILAGVGTGLNALGQWHQGRQQNRRARGLERMALDFGGQSQQPSFLEQILRSQFNTGQDGTMQMLRADTGEGILGQLAGQPFDTTELFQSLQPIRNRQLGEGLGQLFAGAPGLGQRFGSSMMQEGGNLTNRFLQEIAAQDAGMRMQSHEAHQNRVFGGGMNLLQLLGQAEQGRRGMGLAAVQTAAGMPWAPQQNWGQPAMDMGQLLLLQQLLA